VSITAVYNHFLFPTRKNHQPVSGTVAFCTDFKKALKPLFCGMKQQKPIPLQLNERLVNKPFDIGHLDYILLYEEK
jgi:hypothetical protein